MTTRTGEKKRPTYATNYSSTNPCTFHNDLLWGQNSPATHTHTPRRIQHTRLYTHITATSIYIKSASFFPFLLSCRIAEHSCVDRFISHFAGVFPFLLCYEHINWSSTINFRLRFLISLVIDVCAGHCHETNKKLVHLSCVVCVCVCARVELPIMRKGETNKEHPEHICIFIAHSSYRRITLWQIYEQNRIFTNLPNKRFYFICCGLLWSHEFIHKSKGIDKRSCNAHKSGSPLSAWSTINTNYHCSRGEHNTEQQQQQSKWK